MLAVADGVAAVAAVDALEELVDEAALGAVVLVVPLVAAAPLVAADAVWLAPIHPARARTASELAAPVMTLARFAGWRRRRRLPAGAGRPPAGAGRPPPVLGVGRLGSMAVMLRPVPLSALRALSVAAPIFARRSRWFGTAHRLGIFTLMPVAVRPTKWRHRHPTDREAVHAWLAQVTAALDREAAKTRRADVTARLSPGLRPSQHNRHRL